MGNKREGRGKEMAKDTKRQVIELSHGRCMFEGCAAPLLADNFTGEKAYFGYLAHIVASSEKGPRGVKGLSGELSNNPSNIMLLCDKHHRLIDKVAEADYPKERLDNMRQKHIDSANRLLAHMEYLPVKAFYAGFIVNQQLNTFPCPKEVAQCLAVCQWRLSEIVYSIELNGICFDDESKDLWNVIAPKTIEKTALEIELISSGQSPIALFAIGSMPLLIAIGARLGNKSKLVPMLRVRSSDSWEWPDESKTELNPKLIENKSKNSESSVLVLAVFLTDSPFSGTEVLDELADSLGAKLTILSVDNPSNTVIGHPDTGLEFQHYLNSLLHKFKKSGIEHIHLVVCASNAACVYIGRAIEQYHPSIILYNLYTIKMNDGTIKKSVRPVLQIIPSNSGPEIKAIED